MVSKHGFNPNILNSCWPIYLYQDNNLYKWAGETSGRESWSTLGIGMGAGWQAQGGRVDADGRGSKVILSEGNDDTEELDKEGLGSGEVEVDQSQK